MGLICHDSLFFFGCNTPWIIQLDFQTMFKHINIENLYLNFCKIYLNRINKLTGKSVKQFCSKMKFVMLSEKKT